MAAFVRDSGNGPAVLCLHSNASSSAQWRALTDLLAPTHRVLAVDLLGAGRSDPWPVASGARLRHELDALAPVLQAAGGPLHLVGHSYGGAVALAAALAWPGQVRSLVLYEPTLFPLLGQPGPGAPGATGIAAVGPAAVAAVARGDLQAAAELFIDYWMGPGSWAAMPQPRRGPVAESMRPVGHWVDAVFAESWSLPALAELPMPVLVLGGERSPASARDLLPMLAAALPGARVQVLPGLGHMAPVTHPQQVNPLVAQFLADQAASARAQSATSGGPL